MINVSGSNPLFPGGSRLEILSEAGVPILETSHQESPRAGQSGISGYRRVAENSWIGMQGLDSCVGLVVLWKEGDRTQAVVAHFNVQDDAGETLRQYEAKHGLFIPPGATAFIGGGEESAKSLSLLKGVIGALKSRKAKISSYHPYSSLWVSEKGLLAFSYDRSIYARDYTSPIGREAMDARQKELTAKNAADTLKAQLANGAIKR